MTISKIYETALYLAEKTDDNSGLIDEDYKKQHKEKAIELIKQALLRFISIEGLTLTNISNLSFEDNVLLPGFILKSVIPYYVAAILCQQDGEYDKYNVLIYEYEQGIKSIKHKEERIDDVNDILSGLEG